MSTRRQRIVVIGHSSTLRLGIVRAAGELGCEITVVVQAPYWPFTRKMRKARPYDCYSKYISQVYYCAAGDGEGLVRLLLDRCKVSGQKAILFPTSDLSAVTIDDNKDRLSTYFVFPHLVDSSETIRGWMDKSRQKDLARRLGLSVPESKIVEIRDGAYAIPEGIRYPCFTKALVSIDGGKDYFRRCDNREELKQALDDIRKEVRILVEDYKEIETEYAVLGFSSGTDVVIPGIIRLVCQTASHFGVAMKGEVLPVDGFEGILDAFKSLVLQIGFVGVFDIDFYESGGEIYFGEMNLRFGGSGYAVTRSGVNLPAMLIRHFRGEDMCGMQDRVLTVASFVNERMCEDDWVDKKITTEEYNRILSSSDICFVRSAEDPAPYRMYRLQHRFDVIKKSVKPLLKRFM